MKINSIKTKFIKLCLFSVGIILLFTNLSWAIPVNPTSYDMPNGDGQSHGGIYNYWDKFYTGTGATSGSGDKTTDREFLSGGLGDLTDGIITSDNWFDIEKVDGTGPYVGWHGLEPTITFNFTNPTSIESVMIHVDDSDGTGGVRVPGQVDISDGSTTRSFSISDPIGSDPLWFTFSNLGLYGSSLDLKLYPYYSSSWVFIDEVKFDDSSSSPIPEPNTMLLFGSGLIGVAGFRRRFKKS